MSVWITQLCILLCIRLSVVRATTNYMLKMSYEDCANLDHLGQESCHLELSLESCSSAGNKEGQWGRQARTACTSIMDTLQ